MTSGVAGVVAGSGDLASQAADGTLHLTGGAHGQAFDAFSHTAGSSLGDPGYVSSGSHQRRLTHGIEDRGRDLFSGGVDSGSR
jgi:hypothetical protein